MTRTLLRLAIAVICAALVYLSLPLDDLALRKGLALLTLIALLWMTETFHITVTALLVPLLTVLSGIFSVSEALKNFANPIIFLFLGGFALAAALGEQQLDRQIAAQVLRLARGDLRRAAILLCLASAGLSMWISNTATTAMMLPLALGLLKNVDYEEQPSTHWFVLLGIAYSASIGGIGTLVGSPPNAIAAAEAGLSFFDWLRFGLPVVLIALPLMLAVLWWSLKPELAHRIAIQTEHQPLNRTQWATLGVFALTVTLWLFSAPLAKWLGIKGGFDSLVALLAILLLCILKLVPWKEIERSADWGVLLLFGGGLTLSAMLQATGSSRFLAESISQLLADAGLPLFILCVTAFVVMLTEIASNTASAALLVPIFIGIAKVMGIHPQLMASIIAIAASCAFMLPVATPPNAIIFGSGKVPQAQMMRVGLRLNTVMTLLITLGALLLI